MTHASVKLSNMLFVEALFPSSCTDVLTRKLFPIEFPLGLPEYRRILILLPKFKNLT